MVSFNRSLANDSGFTGTPSGGISTNNHISFAPPPNGTQQSSIYPETPDEERAGIADSITSASQRDREEEKAQV
jgi:hypothetical protein